MHGCVILLQVLAVIEQLQQDNPTPKPARSPLVSGTWRLVWSQQAEDASPLQKWGSAQTRNYQVIDAEAGTLENVVDLGFSQVGQSVFGVVCKREDSGACDICPVFWLSGSCVSRTG